MKLPYRITDAANRLYRAGVAYHTYGTLKVGKTSYFNYYKADKVTDSQLEALREFCPDVRLKGIRSQYAPELQAVGVFFPKIAWYKLRKTDCKLAESMV